MRVFGLLLLSGLGVMAVANFADRLSSIASIAHELGTIVATGLGIGYAWLADFNLWKLWHLAVREDWIGVTLTGLILGGLAVFWRELVGFFASLVRKFTDEAVAI